LTVEGENHPSTSNVFAISETSRHLVIASRGGNSATVWDHMHRFGIPEMRREVLQGRSPFADQETSSRKQILQLYLQLNCFLNQVGTCQAIIDVKGFIHCSNSHWIFKDEIESILHVCCKRGSRETKCNSCDAIILQHLTRILSPDKSVEIPM